MPKLILEALAGRSTERTPLWFMRQAGRCLPEYRAIKEKMQTYNMFRTPETAVEVTLQPLKRFALDAAIVYADILHIPDALGCGLSFQPGDGPKFDHTVQSDADLNTLRDALQNKAQVLDELSFVGKTLSGVKPQLQDDQTLIGFAGAPWTVASYVVEGGGSKTFFKTKRLMMEQPEVFCELMDILTEVTIPYLHMQVDNGAEVLQLFESWGGTALTPSQYRKFCGPWTQRICEELGKRVPVIHFINKGAGLIDETSKIPSKGYGVDWGQPLDRVRQHPRLQDKTLQGNIDPLFLYGNEDNLLKEAESILQAGRQHKGGYIFNVGHGITPETPLDKLAKLIDFVRAYR